MIKHKIHPNLPAFIFSDMVKVVKNRDSTLVYGMVLSVVFRHLAIDIRCDTLFLQHPSTFLDEHSLGSMGYLKEQNIWVKKAERGAIDPDEVALGANEVHVEGDEHERERHEIDVTAGISSSAVFDTRSAFEVML